MKYNPALKNASQDKNTEPSKMEADAYSLPPKESKGDNMADVICRIMDDDGPRPMARLRPAKKTPNAADQFNVDHQQPYEAYGARSQDRVEAVRVHNSGYPKMHDELEKKRSTGKVTMSYARRNVLTQRSTQNRCAACKKRAGGKRRGRVAKGARDVRRRAGPRRATVGKGRGTSQRIPKFRSKSILQKMAVEKGTLTCRDLFTGCKDKSNSSQCSEEASRSSKQRNPEGTDASVSSYNSYASLEHEPMVSN